MGGHGVLQVTPQIFSSTWPGLHVELKHFNPPKERRHRRRDAREMGKMNQSFDQVTPRPFDRRNSGDSAITAVSSASLRKRLSNFILTTHSSASVTFRHSPLARACVCCCVQQTQAVAWLVLRVCLQHCDGADKGGARM